MALGLGLLIGAERERNKGTGAERGPAGLRTFTFAALAGAVSAIAGGPLLLAVTVAGTAALAAAAYARAGRDDPGLTTEAVLVLTTLLGGLAIAEPGLAAGLGVLVAILLAARDTLHGFIREGLSEREMADGLTFAAVTLIVWPLLPNQMLGPPLDPLNVINPHALWLIVILFMAIGAAGHVAARLTGARYGLPIMGLLSGFVSSAGTIAAMGQRAKAQPDATPAAVAGAVLSNIATIAQMALLLAAIDPRVLLTLAAPLAAAGATAALYGAFFIWRAVKSGAEAAPERGHAFDVRTALWFALLVGLVTMGAAALRQAFGEAGLTAGAAFAGFADAHAGAVSVASLAASGALAPGAATAPILACLTTNSITKIIAAVAGGPAAYWMRVAPGVALVLAAAWAAALATRAI